MLLLTPGPLTTSSATRAAMDHDFGSRDPAFIELIARVRAHLAGLVEGGDGYTTVPMQGSGTFAVESMLGTFVPPDGKLLVCVNGAYGRRMVQIAQRIGRRVLALPFAETEPVDAHAVGHVLAADPAITHVAIVHCETTTGLLNPLHDVARTVALHDRRLLIDAMSAFGALPLRAFDVPFDAVAASANKCLEGVPGIGFVIARRSAIAATAGHAPSLSLDLHDQWQRLEQDGQFRFTPPTHVLAALDAALQQHADEGGVAGRGARYQRSCDVLVAGLRDLGLSTLLPDDLQAPIIVTVLSPKRPDWDFAAAYNALVERGFAIYPGKLTEADTFRVGCIGQVHEHDIRRFLVALSEVLA